MINMAIIEPLNSKGRFAIVIPEKEIIKNDEFVLIKDGETYSLAVCKGGSFISESDAVAEELIFNQKPKKCNSDTNETDVKIFTII